MRLLLTDETFTIEGLPYLDIPFLLDEEMRLAEQANAFLIHLAVHRGATESKTTWLTYGWHLYDYFSFLEANSLRWDRNLDPESPTVVSLYRNWSAKINKPKTVNQRLGTIARFYRFAHKRGWIAAVPWDVEQRVVAGRSGFLAHVSVGATADVPDIMLKEKPALIEVLTRVQIHQLLQHLNPNKTHFLMAKLALATGLRKEELMTFPVKYVFNPESRPGVQASVKVPLSPADMRLKGSKPRAVFMSRALMRELWDYLALTRTPIENQCIDLGLPVAKSLFITARGKAYSSSAFQKVLTRAGVILGFHIHPHILRHSFATHELHAMREAKGKTDVALLWVKERLGHSSITQTEVYLHLLAELEHDYLAAYQYDLDSLTLNKEPAHA